MNPQQTTFIIAGAILLPVVIAAAVGLPTWFAARTRGEYLALAADYRAAVGLPPETGVSPASGVGKIPAWMKGYYAYLIAVSILKMIHPSLSFTAHLLIFAGVGLHFLKRCFLSWQMLRTHPGLEPRLRRVPLIEIITFGLIALMALSIVHLMVVIGAPSEFGEPLM